MRYLVLFAAVTLAAAPQPIENSRYRVRLSGTSVEIAAGAASKTFLPRFLVLATTRNPDLTLRWGKFPGREVPYNVATWSAGSPAAKAVESREHVADGFNPAYDQAAGADRITNAFASAPHAIVTAEKATLSARRIDWTFPAQPGFALKAWLELPAGDAAPVLSFEFTPSRPGWYSVAYTGAPEVAPASLDEMWQSLIWQEKRFPTDPYMTEAFRCPIPGTLVTEAGITTSVQADPSELPFQPLPTLSNSRFGVAVRNAAGNAQSVVLAPMLGGPGSKMEAGRPFSFRLRLVVNRGTAFETYRHIAESLFGFHDYRRNHSVSLNRTFENIVRFAMSKWARFDDDLRGSAYDTDVPGSVKNISSLHPLGVALVTDSEEIFAKRARPMIEYALSRERFLFTVDPKVKGQGASSNLDGPGAPLSELAALYSITGDRSPFFLDAAKDLLTRKRALNLDTESDGMWWGNLLALYKATGDRAWRERARAGADRYLEERLARKQTDFSDPHSRGMFFWTSFVPPFAELYELWEVTHERRYLDAALYSARLYTEFTWMAPAIPDRDILVNESGEAPRYRTGKQYTPIAIAPETSPAWRLSEIGLTPESSGTSKGHRGIFLASYAPYFLRLAQAGGDDYLKAVGRSAVVGRYTAFPGYHINTARTTAYEKPDFAERPMLQLNSTTSLHYNHIWAQAAMVLDYLVSDTVARSGGEIDFPSHFAEGYAYVTSKVYGDRPGRFYGEYGAWLWMPEGLVTAGDVQVNYIAARGNGKLYLALTNQSPDAVSTELRLNPSLVPVSGNRTVRVWLDNKTAPYITMRNGVIPVRIAGRGITALAIEDVRIAPKFLAGGSSSEPWSKTSADTPLARGHARLIDLGPMARSVYFWVQENGANIQSVTLQYSTGGDWRTLKDEAYPFEFTVPLTASEGQFRFRYEITRKDGGKEKSEEVLLEERRHFGGAGRN